MRLLIYTSVDKPWENVYISDFSIQNINIPEWLITLKTGNKLGQNQ